MTMPSRHHSLAWPLLLACVALVLYASLFPFNDWRWPPGQSLLNLLQLPWPRWIPDAFDVWSNLLGYAPLGALALLAARRTGWAWTSAVLGSVLLGTGLSYATEVTQQFLPGRHPSMKDFALNTAGTALGVACAAGLYTLGWLGRWHDWRERWFVRDSGGALALLMLWPAALLFPTPVPLGLGQWGDRLRDGLANLLADVPWAETAHALLAAPDDPTPALRPLTEAAITALGLLAPCVVAYSVVLPGWRRAVLALGALLVALGFMTLSTALNFSPQHALAWMTPFTLPGLGFGIALAWLCAPLPRRLMAGVGLVALTGLAAAVAQAPDDPYFAQSLQAWEQGRFVRFHGVAQWLGWLWPYAAMAWLLARLAARPERRD